MPQIRTLLDQETITKRVAELGAEINAAYAGEEVTLVVVLKGSFVFAADLARHLDMPVNIEFLAVRSYGDGTQTTGVVEITSDLGKPIEGKNVVLVEDIVDTGLTMQYLMANFETRAPKSLRLVSLLHKPARSRVEIPIDFLGFTIEDVFVVGYGLDFAQHYRNLPYLGVLEPDE